MRARTPREVIDQAIEENRFGERVLYFLACAFAIIGVLMLAVAAWNRLPLVGGVGGVSTVLCWPAVASARQTRKESIAIRLLEAPLSRADTAHEAAQMLQELFNRLMLPKEDRAQARAQAAD
jgi:hypothetical protein